MHIIDFFDALISGNIEFVKDLLVTNRLNLFDYLTVEILEKLYSKVYFKLMTNLRKNIAEVRINTCMYLYVYINIRSTSFRICRR